MIDRTGGRCLQSTVIVTITLNVFMSLATQFVKPVFNMIVCFADNGISLRPIVVADDRKTIGR